MVCSLAQRSVSVQYAFYLTAIQHSCLVCVCVYVVVKISIKQCSSYGSVSTVDAPVACPHATMLVKYSSSLQMCVMCSIKSYVYKRGSQLAGLQNILQQL
jgi:hypothetical protein